MEPLKATASPRKTLTCPKCGFTVRRRLTQTMAGSRGHHETAAVPASCPRGCGPIPDPDVPGVVRPAEIDVERGRPADKRQKMSIQTLLMAAAALGGLSVPGGPRLPSFMRPKPERGEPDEDDLRRIAAAERKRERKRLKRLKQTQTDQ